MTDADARTATTPGLVCAHHHLYSALARGMPAPPRTPTNFPEILELVWWRLDRALDLDMIRWSARLGAPEALEFVKRNAFDPPSAAFDAAFSTR